MKQTLEGVLKYLRKNYCSYWIILGIDTAIAVLCTWIAYIGIYSMTGISVRTDVFAKIIGISFISSILGSYIFRTYRNTIRFSQLKELWRLMGSACLKAICMVIAIWIFIPQMGLSNSQRMIFVLFDGMLTFIAMAGFRIQLILIYEFLLNQMNKKNERILIYGKDDKSVALQVRLMNSRHFKVVGFYVYDTSASILRVAGFPVYSFKNEGDFKRQMHFVPIIGDVRVKERLRMVFETYQPQIIFHAAAYKHVPLMEENPCEAVLVNVVGSRQVADMAVEYGAEKMIMVSTDKAVNPTNVMGCSKRLAEIYVQSLGCAIREGKVKGRTKFITTRFGNVLGSNGSVIPRFKEQIENGGPVTVTHPDIIRFFMTIPEACRLVMEAATMSEGNEIFVFEMGTAVKIVDLATRMIELAGYRPGEDIEIEFTGLRPGEKLYEEVLSDKENTIPTENKKIMIAKVRHYEYTDILDTYGEFENLSRTVKIMDTVKLMKKVVPEFKSKNSPKFEVLDNN